MNYETLTSVLAALIIYRMLAPGIDRLAKVLWMSPEEVKERLERGVSHDPK